MPEFVKIKELLIRRKRVKNKIFPIIKTIVFMIISTAIMILLMTLLFYKAEIDENGIRIGAVITYLITTFIGGFIFGKVNESKKYLFGLMIGAVYFVLLIICSAMFGSGENMFSGRMIIAMISCLSGGMLGGMISS